MKERSLSSEKVLLLVSVFSLALTGGVLSFTPSQTSKEPQVLQAQDVNVSASVLPCEVDLRASPEKRINPAVNGFPPSDNLQSALENEVYGSTLTDFRGDFTVASDDTGVARINICDEGISIGVNEQIDLYVTGQSHITKLFTVSGAFDTAVTFIDTEAINGELLAGETHQIFNNFINELDISTQVITLGTNDNINDLNQDQIVNELDLSNTVINLNVGGDCSPQQALDGVELCV